jgi:hypothetical protein
VSYETSGAGIFRQIFDQIEDRHRAIEVLKCLFQRRREALLEYTLLEESMEHEIQRTHNMVEHVRAGHGDLQSDLDVMKNKTAGQYPHCSIHPHTPPPQHHVEPHAAITLFPQWQQGDGAGTR